VRTPQPTSGCTSIHFGENQLSPGSIGISPLSTGHPPVLQHGWVRASTRSYPRFTLPMDSSPGFGSDPGNARPPRLRAGTLPQPCSGSLSLRLHGSLLSPQSRLQGGRLTCWGLSPTARCPDQLAGSFYKRHAVRHTPLRPALRPAGGVWPSDCVWVLGFRVSFIPPAGCFSPFPHGTRALSVARTYPALEGGPPCFPQDTSCPVVLRIRVLSP
jgi:hypothetical protein